MLNWYNSLTTSHPPVHERSPSVKFDSRPQAPLKRSGFNTEQPITNLERTAGAWMMRLNTDSEITHIPPLILTGR